MSSPTLTIANPTPAERIALAKATWPQWGGGLSLEAYLGRETDTVTGLNRDGGIVGWFLTEAGAQPDARPLLTGCDTLRKRALVKGKDGVVRDTVAQGVASVFTPEEQRGKGYAGKLMGLLSETLGARADEAPEGEEPTLFSVLFSDVGKEFYAKRGWKAYHSAHLTFPLDQDAGYTLPEGVKYITKDDIPELTALDEKLLRQRMAELPKDDSRISVAIIPDQDHVVWHIAREVLKSTALYPSDPPPQTHGAIVTIPSSNTRVWALWARKLRSKEDISNNSVYLMRFVVEAPEKVSDEELSGAVEKIVVAAKAYGKQAHCGKVQLWSPEDRVKKVAEANQGLGTEYHVRDSDSIVSLNWFGEGSVDEVDWLIPQQYTWC